MTHMASRTDRKDLLGAIQTKTQEIKVLQEQVIQMSRSYNSTSFASSLPSEILFLIFKEYFRHPALKITRTDPWESMRILEEVEDPRDSDGLDDPVEENPPHRRWLVLAESLEILLDQSEVKGTYVPEPSLGFAAFMEADFRSLRHVALTNVHTKWQLLSKLPSTVTDLSITNELQPLLAGPMSDVLDVLKKLVDLKRLTLYDCLPRMAGGSTERVYLSKLEKLTIAGEITRVMPLFDCLEHPLATIVCVGLEVDPGQDISSASLSVFSRMCRMYEGRPDQMEASICVARAYVSISLFADTVPESQLFFKPTENGDDTQSISSLDLLRGALEAATATLFSSITSLWLTFLDHHTHDAPRLLPLIFQILNRVESITVEGQVTLLTEALRPQQDMPVSLPRLSHLGLADTRIVEDTEDQPFRILSADVLYSCLEGRKDHGCGIQLLELYDDCNLHVSAADEFRERLLTVVKDIEGWEK
ncbi:hypothetical protein QCA50_016896 [Cerrena zonata]|uniref:F-box domain-containing protein n=1 Tax=Cerrena zonata TaxID=2478898 RepID=A0AAW0FEG2_9APHY